jgi:hypothetical protein
VRGLAPVFNSNEPITTLDEIRHCEENSELMKDLQIKVSE